MTIVTTPSQGWSSFFSVVDSRADPATDNEEKAVASGRRHAIEQVGGLSAETFRSWTATTQEMYLRIHRKDGGVLDIDETGKDGKRVRYQFKLDATGSVVTRAAGDDKLPWTAAPSGKVAGVADPTRLTAATFKSWNTESQKAYLAMLGEETSASANLSTGVADTYEHFVLRTSADGRTSSVMSSGTYTAEGWQPTLGMKEKIPYHYLPGSASGSGDALSKASDALFPELDGLTNKLPEAERPANFGIDPATIAATPDLPKNPTKAQQEAFDDALATANKKWAEFIADFNTWHSAYQIEYVDKYGKVPTDGTQKVLQIPVPTLDKTDGTKFSVPPLTTAMISSEEPRKLYRLEAISKQDIALMSKADQTTFSKTPVFAVTMHEALGLTTEYAQATAKLNALDTRLDTMFDKPAVTEKNNARAIFKEELELLRQQVTNSALYSKAQIDDAVTAIETRVNRLAAFYDVKATPQGTTTQKFGKVTGQNDDGDIWTYTEYGKSTNVISLDDGKSVSNAFTTMLGQEARILETARARASLAGNGANEVMLDGRGVSIVTSGTGKRIDAPTLIYLLQDKYNQQLEAEVAIETEYVKQVNELLKTYAAMQDAVNKTLGGFTKTEDDGEPRTSTLEQAWIADVYDGNPTEHERNLQRVIQMFDRATGNVKNPVEALQKVERPTEALTGSNSDGVWFTRFTHQQWTTYGNRLSDAVTQLNQESQMRMNEINNKDKERNRHYELANSSLTKMNDALQGILRAMA